LARVPQQIRGGNDWQEEEKQEISWSSRAEVGAKKLSKRGISR
jgi:hypothetical protein